MFYALRFKFALSELGIKPSSICANHKRLGQVVGSVAGCTPQEAVIMILGELPPSYHVQANTCLVADWVTTGKVDPGKIAIRAAVGKIGWDWFLYENDTWIANPLSVRHSSSG